MSTGKVEGPAGAVEIVEEELERGAREADPAEVAETDTRLEELFDKVADPPVSQAPAALAPRAAASAVALAGVAMRTAQPVALRGRMVALMVRGVAGEVEAELGPGVEVEVVKQAVENGDAVVIECAAGETPLVVGVLQRRVPRELNLRARKIHIEGEEEVLLRSGRGALRIRQDGDVELVGSRIAAMSRGLFRLVGRVLRLN